MKVVSLVPSLTELLLYLGVEVVGRTKFCIHPAAEIGAIPKVGGTKTVHTDQVVALEPDLVIANKEENVAEQVGALQEAGLQVLVTDIKDYDTALAAIDTIGAAVGRTSQARLLVADIERAFQSLPQAGLSVCYLIWRKPYMTIGGDTYIHDMLTRCGYTNVYQSQERYPEVTLEELQSRRPDVVMLSSEPFPFAEKHIAELQEAMPDSTVVLVDGEYFSWYGSRMVAAAKYFRTLYSDHKIKT